jgi:hypothetical protein
MLFPRPTRDALLADQAFVPRRWTRVANHVGQSDESAERRLIAAARHVRAAHFAAPTGAYSLA